MRHLQTFGSGGALFVIALIGLASLALSAQAQSPGSLVLGERVAKVEVTPAVADVGVERTITISGIWPGCVPVGAQLIDDGRTSPTTRLVRMNLPLTLVACPAAYLPYTVTTKYTPKSRGIDRLLIQNTDGEYLGEGLLDTRAPDNNRSAYNITGMWYDPASNGSGLTFVHSRADSSNNAVFGTWYVYDSSGMPRWYTIQNAEWKSGGLVLEGTMYETRASASCPIVFLACPAPLSQALVAGRARFTITGTGSAKAEALNASGAVVFTSNLIRAEI